MRWNIKLFWICISFFANMVYAAPDFVVVYVSGPSSATPGSTVNVTVSGRNNGSIPTQSGSYVVLRMILSPDAQINLADSYYQDYNIPIGDISGGVTYGHTFSYTIPSGISGTYYWGGYVDATTYWSESNENNNALAGNTITFSAPPATVPTLSYPGNGAVLDDTTPDLSWSANNANYFHVQVDNNSNFSSPERENTNVNSWNWTPSSMPDGTYYWRVRSHGTDGNWSGWSSVWSFTIQTTQPSTVPALSYPANGATLNDATPDLSWSANNANYFHVQIDNNSDFSSPERENTNVSAWNWTPSSMSDGTYYWRVRSHGIDGNWSGWSSVWSFTISTITPGSVSGGVRDGITSNPIDGATVRLKQGGSTQYETTSASNGTFTINDVVPGTYDLEGSKSGYQNYSYSVTVGNGQSVTGKNLALQPSIVNGSVSGGVRDGITSNPIDGATVRLKQGGSTQYETTSASNGTFTINDVVPGTYDLEGSYSGYQNYSYSVTVGNGQNVTGKNLALQPNYVPNPQVSVSPISGPQGTTFNQPGTGFTPGGQVVLHFKYPNNTEQQFPKTAASDGTYSNSWPSPADAQVGTYQYWAVDVNSGKTSNTVSYQITSNITNGSVSGGVRDATTNASLDDATVRLKQSGTTKYETTSVSNGTYSFSSVTPGTYDLEGSKSGYQNNSYSVTVGNGQSVTGKNLALQPNYVPNPQVSVNPTSGVQGTTFNQPGRGFTPGGQVVLHFKYPDNTEQQLPKTAGGDGSYSNSWPSATTAQVGTYTYWAVDVNSGKTSNTVNYQITQKNYINPPTNFTALAFGNSVKLFWIDNSTNEDGYKIFRRVGEKGNFTLYYTVNSNAEFKE